MVKISIMVNIDEIYNMLSWENDIEVQISGIQKAKKIKSLNTLILPILSTNSKAVWENCAKVLISKSNIELKPYLTQIFKWLQDLNWPGANLIFNRLLDIPFKELETPLNICLSMANKTNDFPWLQALIAFKELAEKTGNTGDG